MRAIEFIVEDNESRTEEFHGVHMKLRDDGYEVVASALDDWGREMGSVVFNKGDGNELDPQDLLVIDKFRGQGIAKVMYDYVKSKGYEIHKSYDVTKIADQGKESGEYFWQKNRGEERIWEQGISEGSSNNIPTIGINVRSDGNIDYASLIVDGEKKYESRKTDSLRPYVGKTVGIVRTGNGPAVAIGQVTIGEPIVVDAEKFNRLRKQHLVPQGSKFDIDSDGTKYLYPMIDPVRWDNEKLIKHKGIVSRKIEEDKSKDPIANAILDFYQHVGDIKKEPVDNYVGTAKEMLGQVSDPKVKSKILDIFKQAKQNPYVQGGVVTTIGALLAGGVLSSAQKMGLSPSQTNLALQAILNTVIPTVVSRINGKSWSDTIKYTLASAGIGTGIAGMMEQDSLDEDWKSALATGAMAGAMAMSANAKAPNMVRQIVEPGDTVYSIARQNNVNPLEIYKLNKMDRTTKLEVGQKVLVPDYSKPISKMPATVKPTVAQSTTSFKDKLTSMIPKFSRDKEEEEGVTLLSDNGDAEAVLQTAAKNAGLKGAELAQFMAQTRHESWDFGQMKEVGNKKRFAKYETPRKAKQLGNKIKGDGERFKGRGFIQLTGRDNYTRASQQIFGDDRLVKNPDLASRPDIGAQIALWFWENRVRPNVNNFNNTKEVTNAINPGLSGLQDRHNKFKEYLAVL
jgi:putative chitinase